MAMRNFFFALAATVVLAMMPGGKAEAAAFCAYAGGPAGGGYESCGFYTWQQCLDTVRGSGGFCMRNPHDPALWGSAVPPGRK
jgi:hypothetical protein